MNILMMVSGAHGAWAARNMGNFNKDIPPQTVNNCSIFGRGISFLIYGVLGTCLSFIFFAMEPKLVFWMLLSLSISLFAVGVIKILLSNLRNKRKTRDSE